METVLLAADTLSRLIVIKSNYYSDKGYAHYDKDGYALVGEASVFAEKVKIEAERATVDDRYVNMRFCHSNKYWERKGGKYIVAESNKPDEDITKSSCTLFEAVGVAGGNGLFYLNHVQSGGRLLLEEPSMRFYVEPNSKPDDQSYLLRFVNWNSFVKLSDGPVVFKGYNDCYLEAVYLNGHNHLLLSGKDPKAQACCQEIQAMSDGSLRIKSTLFDKFWIRSTSNWIVADSTDTKPNKDKVFLLKILDETTHTIALRNAGNNNYCEALTTEKMTDCLNAAVKDVTADAKLVVQELVLWREIYNVRYWVENSRIYNETPFVAGTTTAINNSDSEAQIAVEVSYEDEKSYSFSHSYSLTFGAKITFTAGIPRIVNNQVEVGVEIIAQMEWGKTTPSKETVKATGSVTVPPRSAATVIYVGKTGTCDVPFSYTQEGTHSTDGTIVQSEHIDGVFKGINNYNFSFVIRDIEPL